MAGQVATRFPLLVDEGNNYQHRYSSLCMVREKIKEIETRLLQGSTEPGLVKQLSELQAEATSCRTVDPPSVAIATLNPLSDGRPSRRAGCFEGPGCGRGEGGCQGRLRVDGISAGGNVKLLADSGDIDRARGAHTKGPYRRGAEPGDEAAAQH